MHVFPSHLHPSLSQIHSTRQFFPREDVWIVRLFEYRLQLSQLKTVEVCSISPLFLVLAICREQPIFFKKIVCCVGSGLAHRLCEGRTACGQRRGGGEQREREVG